MWWKRRFSSIIKWKVQRHATVTWWWFSSSFRSFSNKTSIFGAAPDLPTYATHNEIISGYRAARSPVGTFTSFKEERKLCPVSFTLARLVNTSVAAINHAGDQKGFSLLNQRSLSVDTRPKHCSVERDGNFHAIKLHLSSLSAIVSGSFYRSIYMLSKIYASESFHRESSTMLRGRANEKRKRANSRAAQRSIVKCERPPPQSSGKKRQQRNASDLTQQNYTFFSSSSPLHFTSFVYLSRTFIRSSFSSSLLMLWEHSQHEAQNCDLCFLFRRRRRCIFIPGKKTARDDDEMKSFGKGQEILGRRRSRALLLLHCKSFWRASVCAAVTSFLRHCSRIWAPFDDHPPQRTNNKKIIFSRRLREAQKIQKCV